VIGRKRLLVSLPWGVASLMGSVLQHLPGKVITPDQVRSLRVDNIVSEAALAEGRTFEAFGITPTTLGSVLPTYLSQYRVRGEYEKQAV
jgi:NADH dehydrogenase